MLSKTHQLEEERITMTKLYLLSKTIHRLIAMEDSKILEVSTPELGTTFRLEDDYKRSDETEEMRNNERQNL